MIIYAPLFMLCIVFVELFIRLGIGKDAMAIVARSREAMGVLLSPELGDDEKEAFMRRGSVDIFKATFLFAMKFVLIGVVLYLLYLLVVSVLPGLKHELLAKLIAPVPIVILTIGTMAYARVRSSIFGRG